MNYRNAKYIAKDIIDCEIEHPEYGWIPYTLNPRDTDNTIDNDSLLRKMAFNNDVEPYVPPTKEEIVENAAKSIRNIRDVKLMTEVDIIAGNVLRWNSLSSEKQELLKKYRQDLLDITLQENFPHSVSWPIYPL